MAGSHPIGTAFRPSDVELINFYLRREIAGELRGPARHFIRHVDVNSAAPYDLAAQHAPAPGTGDADARRREWYFFSPVRYVSASRRTNRSRTVGADGKGTWHSEGGKKRVSADGYLTKFSYKENRASGTVKLGWLMDEFCINGADIAICKIYKSPRGPSNTYVLSAVPVPVPEPEPDNHQPFNTNAAAAAAAAAGVLPHHHHAAGQSGTGHMRHELLNDHDGQGTGHPGLNFTSDVVLDGGAIFGTGDSVPLDFATAGVLPHHHHAAGLDDGQRTGLFNTNTNAVAAAGVLPHHHHIAGLDDGQRTGLFNTNVIAATGVLPHHHHNAVAIEHHHQHAMDMDHLGFNFTGDGDAEAMVGTSDAVAVEHHHQHAMDMDRLGFNFTGDGDAEAMFGDTMDMDHLGFNFTGDGDAEAMLNTNAAVATVLQRLANVLGGTDDAPISNVAAVLWRLANVLGGTEDAPFSAVPAHHPFNANDAVADAVLRRLANVLSCTNNATLTDVPDHHQLFNTNATAALPHHHHAVDQAGTGHLVHELANDHDDGQGTGHPEFSFTSCEVTGGQGASQPVLPQHHHAASQAGTGHLVHELANDHDDGQGTGLPGFTSELGMYDFVSLDEPNGMFLDELNPASTADDLDDFLD